MGIISVGGLFGNQTISNSETDTVAFTAAGTLNVIGPAGAPPINVTLSQAANVAALATINIVNAHLTLNGVAGVSLQTNYNIGSGGTLDFTNVTSLGLTTNIAFTGDTGRFIISTVYTPTVSTGFSGFGPGKSIDLVSSLISRIEYTDDAGTNTGGTLTVYGPNGLVLNTLPLTTGEFILNNFALTPDGSGGTIIGFESAVTNVTVSPANATLGPNRTINFTVSMTNPITIAGGTPSLSLDDGGTAIYNAALSTPTSIVFTYTVGATGSGQNSPDLNIIATNLNGATVTTVGGNGVNTIGIVGNPVGTLVIDTTAPTVASLTVDRPNAILGIGGTVAFTLALSEPLTITNGTPILTLTGGGIATYDAASSTANSLVFRYTVQPGQNASDLAVTGATLNGALATDLAGNVVNLAGAIANPVGTLVVDTIAPTIGAVTVDRPNAILAANGTVTFSVALSEPTLVTGGTPTLSLSDGGVATYDPASSTATSLGFRYTVQPGQNSPDLTVTGLNLNGASLTDLAGNILNRTGAVTNPVGTLVVDTIAPTVGTVMVDRPNAILGIGGTVAFNVGISEPIVIGGGTPTLSLSDGGIATYDAASSTANNLVFRYTVRPGENATDLTVTGTNPNNALITDLAGNAINLAGAITNPIGTLVVDTIAPTVSAVVVDRPNAILRAGSTVGFTIALNEPIIIGGGTPTLSLSDGGVAIYDPLNSTATTLAFRYTVQPGENAADLSITATNLNNALITDLAGNVVNFAGAIVNPAGTLLVDTLAPTTGTATVDRPNAILSAGSVVNFSIPVGEPVTLIGGTPTLTLSDGGTAIYDAANSTPTNLVFRYTVQPGENASDLAISSGNLNGATIMDAAGNFLSLSSLAANPVGTLVVDTLAPTVTGVTTNPSSGRLTTGDVVSFTVALTEAVILAGATPILTLSDGSTATYDAVHSTATNLVFTHTIQPGEVTNDLAVTSATISGGTIADAAGNALDLSGAIVNPAGILAVDTTPPNTPSGNPPPNILTVTTTPGSGILRAGSTVQIAVTTDIPVVISGGTPVLALSGGGFATYDAVNSTATKLLFNYTVQPGQNTADLTIVGADLHGATIANLTNDPLSLLPLLVNPAGTLQIDTAAPVVNGITTNPASGQLSAGSVVDFVVALSEAALINGGVPTLTLSDGGIATYDAARSTPTNLVFSYVVQSGQNATDLAVTGANTGGATVADVAGNLLDLSALAVNPAGVLTIDTLAPTVTGVTTNPASGQLGAGSIVEFTVALTEAVLVAGTSPILILSDGGTATYDAARSTPNNLVFTHIVQPGQNANDLAITGATLAGTTIADAAGNALDLSRAFVNPAGVLNVNTTPRPSVLNLTTNPSSGTVIPGDVVQFIATTDYPVFIVGGVPVLALSDGGFATYDPVNSTPTRLVFTTPIQPGQNAPDLAVTGYDLRGASIADAGGKPLDPNAFVVNPAGLLSVVGTTPTTPSGTPPTTPSGTTGNIDPTPTAGTPTTPSETKQVYRFFDTNNGTHFYTSDPNERANLLLTRPDLVSEGVGLRAVDPASGDPNAIEVFRFFDIVHGTQFLTASQGERDDLIATRPDLKFEPAGSFFEHTQPQPSDTPVYRFFSSVDGTHFYTDDRAERAAIIQTRPDLIAEGIGFYEPS